VSNWNFADIWETVAMKLPDAPALAQSDRRITWSQMNSRANGLAKSFLEAGMKHQDKVAHYLYNCPEYLESMLAMFKAGLVPVNTNYRYADEELTYLWDNADCVAVVFHGTFTERIESLKSRLPRIRNWYWVDDGSGPCPEWATPYEQAAIPLAENVSGPWKRSGDDLLLLYTGGTTGMPKGVMWRQDDLFGRLNSAGFLRFPDDGSVEDVASMVKVPGPIILPACPLMHGTGAFTTLGILSVGGSATMLTKRKFDPVELLDLVQKDKVNIISIVGDAFAKPILAALDANPGKWDLRSVFAIISSGVMWSEEVKKGLFRHHPNFLAIDVFSSSEAIGVGSSVSSATSPAHTAEFTLGEGVKVFNEEGEEIKPGSGEMGLLGLPGRNPIGYYKDPEKSARTFREIGGVRYVLPGDWATVDENGQIHVLGRGSVCINTGGEKVFPEEVEEVIKLMPDVMDVAVVGIPDDRFGEAICAVVETKPGSKLSEADVIEHVKSHLAGYKAPKRVRFVESVGRSPAGKLDYPRLAKEAAAWAGV